MPAQIVTTDFNPQRGRERIVIMDDYGTEFHLDIHVSDIARRSELIDAALAEHTARQAAVDAYASAYAIDLTGAKNRGNHAKAEKKGTL